MAALHLLLERRVAAAIKHIQKMVTADILQRCHDDIEKWGGLVKIEREFYSYLNKPWWQRFYLLLSTPIRQKQRVVASYYAYQLCQRLAQPDWPLQMDKVNSALADFTAFSSVWQINLLPLTLLCKPFFNWFGWQMTLKQFLQQKSRDWFANRQIAIIQPTIQQRLAAYKADAPLYSKEDELIKARDEVMQIFKNDIEFDPFEILQLVDSHGKPNYMAKAADIKSAYKRLALMYHPDTQLSKEIKNSHFSFEDLHKAYQLLLCPLRRHLWVRLCYVSDWKEETMAQEVRRTDARIIRIEKDQQNIRQEFNALKKQQAEIYKDQANFDDLLRSILEKLNQKKEEKIEDDIDADSANSHTPTSFSFRPS